MQYRVMNYLLILAAITNCENMALKTYEVQKIPTQQIILDGKGNDLLWAKANSLTDFQYPWREESAPATTFKALWDDENLYLLYFAEDADIMAKQEDLDERDVVHSDRVEIFFKKDDHMNPYYALELDAMGRILDTECRLYRKIDFDWDWPAGHLTVMASRNNNGYWVEASISLASLQKLGMMEEGQNFLNAGLYRGEYTRDEDGQTVVKWISWVKPESETPDFHIPSSFGRLILLP